MLLEQVEPAKKQGRPEGGGKADNIRLSYGTSQQHTIARLKRDNPDLAESVIRGELTAHAAAIAAWGRWADAYAPVREAAKERVAEGRKKGGGDRKSEEYKERSVEQIPQSDLANAAPKTRDIRAKTAGTNARDNLQRYLRGCKLPLFWDQFGTLRATNHGIAGSGGCCKCLFYSC